MSFFVTYVRCANKVVICLANTTQKAYYNTDSINNFQDFGKSALVGRNNWLSGESEYSYQTHLSNQSSAELLHSQLRALNFSHVLQITAHKCSQDHKKRGTHSLLYYIYCYRTWIISPIKQQLFTGITTLAALAAWGCIR